MQATPEAAPPVIRREAYRPPEWLVPETRLHFELGLEQTRVRADLTVRRNPAAPGDAPLRLKGDGLTALGVWIDGVLTNDWAMDGDDLIVPLSGTEHEVGIETQIAPAANTQLMGLYASNGMLCTQCEAEGFRRITFFPDRPDVLSTYRVRMEGSKEAFPVLLSNGNCTDSGDLPDGRHFADWHDPWPKPSYLFALVAGDLVANHSSFTTMSGRKVDLNIWVREGDQDRTHHAMQALKDSMKWDEEVFGREYDLDLF
ncbi:MAG TPA: aminopeptidase N, partial [Novosphingobium sp.]|nr:aminopeptidase N [Novosphingobium sp.]